jgi:hypothetical protein
MAITYPRPFLGNKFVSNVDIRAVSATALNQSPFTFQSTAYEYAGQMWQADITLRRMDRADAEEWIAWLISLRGRAKTFLMGDPRACKPRGLAGIFPGTPIITSQSGGSITVTGASANKTGWLLPGDYIQIGAGSDATLHKVLDTANTDATGETTLEIWPYLRSERSGSVTVSDPVGNFRLTSNEAGWTSDNLYKYGITFGAMEAI